MSNDLKLNLILKARDGLSGIVHSSVVKSSKDFEALQGKIKGVGDALGGIGKKSAIAGAALVGVSVANLKMSADFETGMSSVATLIDTNEESLKSMGQEVLGIAKRTPVALNDLTSALYDIRSAGVGASEQFNVLKKSAQLGVAGLGSTSEAVDLVTSSLNAFQLKGKEADRVYDTIFKTVKYGKTTIAGIAQGFGVTAGTVAAADIKLDDYLASVAALTTTGRPAAQAHTQIKAAIAGMTRETKESRAVFEALGAKNFKDLIQKSGGVVNAFSRITKQVNGNDAAILQLFGSTEAYAAVVDLTTSLHQSYIDTLNSMRNGPSLIDEAYLKKLNTVNNQLQRGQNLVQAISIDFGSAIAPAFGKMSDVAEKALGVIDRMPDKLKSVIAVSIAVGGIGLSAFGLLLIGAGAVVRGFGDLVKAYGDVKGYLIKNPLKLPKFELGTPLGNINRIKNAISDMVLKSSVKLQILKFRFSDALSGATRSLVTSYNGASNKFIWALNGIKNGFIGLLKPIYSAVRATWLFNAALLTNPITYAVLAIAGSALLIYKYWKPISGFFRGLWQGIKEGMRPLSPAIKGVANAVKPLINWFKRLIKPVEDTNNAAKNFGLNMGKAIGGAITWVAKLGKKFIDLVKWTQPLYWLFKGGKWVAEIHHKNSKEKEALKGQAKKVDGSHASGLVNVPHDGYIAELHKGERVLTAEENKNYNSSKSDITIHYNPVIELMGELKEAPKWLKELLKRHTQEIMRMIKEEKRRKEARAYA